MKIRARADKIELLKYSEVKMINTYSNPTDLKITDMRFVDIDALVLNASLQYRNHWEEIPLSEVYEQLNCNFVSSLMLIQAAVPNMKKKGWGRIVTVGSVQEAKPHPDMLIYSASKAAQTNMVKSLSLQLAPFGITVNNMAPGVIYTDRNVEALSDPEYAKKVTASIPVGFYGTPDDCAGTVSLLCSDEGRYITGQSIYVDGGKACNENTVFRSKRIYIKKRQYRNYNRPLSFRQR